MNTQIKTHSEIQIEPLGTRVAFHPFLAGMNHTQLTLLTDCAVARHFNTDQTILREGEFANGFYLIEMGKVALESEAGFGESIPIQIDWRRRFARLVMDVSAVRLAIYSTRDRADHCALFLRGNSAGILREGSLVRLRASEADQRRDGDALAGCA